MKKLSPFVFSILTLAGCSAQQLASTGGSMQSLNDGFAKAATYGAPPPSFYQQASQPPVPVQENNQIKSPTPWAYPNQPIGTCTKDYSAGTPKIVCY